MFTKTEKGYLVLTLAFLAAGSGIKAYRHAAVKLGPFQDSRQDTLQNTGQDIPQDTPKDIRNARVFPPSPEVQGDASGPEASAAGSGNPGESSTAFAAGPVSPGSGVSQIDGLGGRDAVSDSSILAAMPSVSPISDAAPDTGPDKTPDHAPKRTLKTTSKTTSKSTSKTAFNAKVDLNRAEAPELTRVPGIGAKTARAIVEYRRVHGPYRDFRDLLRIKGIGEKKLEKLMPNLIL